MSFAQSDSVTIKLLYFDLNTFYLKPKVSGETQSRNFKSIHVADMRPDTNRIGIYSFGFKPSTREVKTKQPFSVAIQSALEEKLLSPNGTREILIVLKHCWITQGVGPISPANEKEYRYGINLSIRLKADVYISVQNLWRPLLRIDTTSYSPGDPNEWAERKFNELLTGFAQQLNKYSTVDVTNRKGFSLDSIEHSNASAFTAPAFVTTLLKKGVYKSYSEFRNNSPSISDYEIKREGNFSILYLREKNGNTYYSNNIWGFCDNNQVYVNIALNYFPLFRDGNAFYVYGSDRLEKRTSSLPLIIPFAGYAGHVDFERKKITVDGFRIFVVDLEKGIRY